MTRHSLVLAGVSYVVEESDAQSIVDSSSIPSTIRKQYEFHHIVPQGVRDKCPSCIEARRILDIVGIGVNGPGNIIILETGFHRSIHTNAYYSLACNSVIAAYHSAGSSKIVSVKSRAS
jgi:hypothetical protein